MAKVGGTVPSVLLEEEAPGQTVDLSKEVKDGIIVGVPGKLMSFSSQSRLHAEPRGHENLRRQSCRRVT